MHMADFFAMGGHGTFIWLSYGIAFISLIILGLFSFMKQRSTEQKINALKPERGQRQRRSPDKIKADNETTGTL